MNDKWNPNPLSKLIVLVLFSIFTLFSPPPFYSYLIVVVFAVFYLLMGRKKTAIKLSIIFPIILYYSTKDFSAFPRFLQQYVFILIVIRMFFLQFTAAIFLFSTSDVSSIITSMDKIKLPKAISLPVAVMFRFFPAYTQERKNIKQAMRMRGIRFLKQPIKYFEYTMMPLLIISSNIADDISKYAETKGLSDPCKKTRYKEVSFGIADFLFLGPIILFEVLGKIW
ncbi:MAG: energy-coupling factor transporter transmembrane component T [Tissierellia bacterium]|nr:energy-coupling factor transporter transmembrane component T [Tissierellia bacterium]